MIQSAKLYSVLLFEGFPLCGFEVIQVALPLAWELDGVFAGIVEGSSNKIMEVDGATSAEDC